MFIPQITLGHYYYLHIKGEVRNNVLMWHSLQWWLSWGTNSESLAPKLAVLILRLHGLLNFSLSRTFPASVIMLDIVNFQLSRFGWIGGGGSITLPAWPSTKLHSEPTSLSFLFYPLTLSSRWLAIRVNQFIINLLPPSPQGDK